MQSTDTTPRFRNLSIHGTPRFVTTSLLLNEKEQHEHHNSEKECFMCRQANIYIKPIGMQQERKVARRHPPPLTRAQIDELCEKKSLTKREVRLLLQCYFPEIKNVKYFQLHRYHSCCYDPKHLNLCKNHITAMQHERDQHPLYHHHQHTDEDHFKKYERDNGPQHRVSFVRIKIEPTKGIPTRFLGPTALPEPLADMLIKQVNRMENKKKLPSFQDETQSALDMHTIRRIQQQPYGNGTSRLSEHLATLHSDEEEDDNEEEDDTDDDDQMAKTPNSNIRGYHGKVMDRGQMKNQRKVQEREDSPKDKIRVNGHYNKHGDLIVEDLDELTPLFVHEPNEAEKAKIVKEIKKKRRKKRTKKRVTAHQKPKLNHWEMMALDQSQQEACGCRHHVRRLEADQVVYDWCRCKDHLHKDMKERRKSIAPPPPPPTAPTATPPPKIVKPRKRTIGVNATERTTTELALAYDPTTVDYDVIQEVLYYRTSSGRLVKPEIINKFGFNNSTSTTGLTRFKSLTNKSTDTPLTARSQATTAEKLQKNRSLLADSPASSHREPLSNGQTLVDRETTSSFNGMNVLKTTYERSEMIPTNKFDMPEDIEELDEELDEEPEPEPKPEPEEKEEEEEETDKVKTVQFVPPQYISPSPATSPTAPGSMQKSSKPTYVNQQPTPNFERESSVLASRRWFDQALGDQNLLSVHDGQYGLIAGTSPEEYHAETQLPDNYYVEPYTSLPPKSRSKCTIS